MQSETFKNHLRTIAKRGDDNKKEKQSNRRFWRGQHQRRVRGEEAAGQQEWEAHLPLDGEDSGHVRQ